MMFSSFFEEFPELIEREFRNIFIFDNGAYKYIPPGNYAFLELFCSDTHCDCRKVIINVISVKPTKSWATLNYGWESEKYYKTWWGKSHKCYKSMSGVTFDPPTKNPLKNEFLTIFQGLIQNDKNYVRRIERHYLRFKEKMREKEVKIDTTQKLLLNTSGEKISVNRNDPCSRNSGKKFKRCCLLTVSAIGG